MKKNPLVAQHVNRGVPHTYSFVSSAQRVYLLEYGLDGELSDLEGDVIITDPLNSVLQFTNKFPRAFQKSKARFYVHSAVHSQLPADERSAIGVFILGPTNHVKVPHPIECHTILIDGEMTEYRLNRWAELKHEIKLKFPSKQIQTVQCPTINSKGLLPPEVLNEIIPWESYVWKADLRREVIWPLGLDRWTSDSWCVHKLLSRQASLAAKFTVSSGRFKPVSLFHGYTLIESNRASELDFNNSKTELYQDQFEEFYFGWRRGTS